MSQVTLTKVFRKQETSQKTGKPYTRLAFKCNEYGDQWVSGFGNADNAGWVEGATVEVEIKKVPDGKGGEYVNFETPKGAVGAASDGKVYNYLNLKIEPMLKEIHDAVVKKEESDYPLPANEGGTEVNPDNIPF